MSLARGASRYELAVERSSSRQYAQEANPVVERQRLIHKDSSMVGHLMRPKGMLGQYRDIEDLESAGMTSFALNDTRGMVP